MNVKNLLFASLLAFISLSCSNEKFANAPERTVKTEYALAPEDIYRPEKISMAFDSASLAQKAESRKLFMTGLDLLANKNDAAASIEYFKEAIFYYPDQKTYGFLFQAYLKSNQLDLADSVNTAAFGRMEYSEGNFNYALLYAAKKDTVACIDALGEAIMNGFVFKDRIVNEKLFDFIKDNISFQSLVAANFGSDEKTLKNLFRAYVKTFPELSLPYSMSPDSAKAFSFDKYIDYDFSMFIPGMENGRFSRDVSQVYLALGKISMPNGVAVLYKSYEVIADTLNPVHTNIIVYDTLGKLISTEGIACFCSPLESKGFVISKDLDIEVTAYKAKWENDPLQKGYAGNRVVSNDAVETYKLLITKANTLQKAEGKDAVAASGQ